MPVFEQVSRYPYPREQVFAWHERPGAVVRLMPPGMATVLTRPTDGINTGSQVTLRITHPLLAGIRLPGNKRVGVKWLVEHTELVPGERFVDEQVVGPFRTWKHEHEFADGPDGSTVLTDRITWELPVRLPAGFDQALLEMQLDGLLRFRERQLRDDLALLARLPMTPSHVVVTGSSGLIGRQLCAALATAGHRVTRLLRASSRRAAPANDTAAWDPDRGVLDPAVLADADAVVHLAGEPISGRFTAKHRARVLDSRVRSTTLLVDAIRAARAAGGGPTTLVQASAIGIYGARRPDEVLTEESAPGEGFLAEVVQAWEAAARPAADAGVRVAFLRTGIVLSEGGGALQPMVPLFSMGLGGRLTAPDAYMSWIGLDDMARAYLHVLFTPSLAGPVNAVAPRPVTSQEFADTLGQVLHRPAAIPTPGFAPAVLLGREGASELVATDQRVLPTRLLDTGFQFAQGHLIAALRHALMR